MFCCASVPMSRKKKFPARASVWRRKFPFAEPGALKERQVSGLVEHHEVHKAVLVPIHGHGRRAPLSEQSLALRTQPTVGECGLRTGPFDLDWLGGGEPRF